MKADHPPPPGQCQAGPGQGCHRVSSLLTDARPAPSGTAHSTLFPKAVRSRKAWMGAPCNSVPGLDEATALTLLLALGEPEARGVR